MQIIYKEILDEASKIITVHKHHTESDWSGSRLTIPAQLAVFAVPL